MYFTFHYLGLNRNLDGCEAADAAAVNAPITWYLTGSTILNGGGTIDEGSTFTYGAHGAAPDATGAAPTGTAGNVRLDIGEKFLVEIRVKIAGEYSQTKVLSLQ